jgi:alpha/beta superfamily hydrolase
MTDTHYPRGHVLFSGDDRLEGILEWPEGADSPAEEADVGTALQAAAGVVVAHPHPLYGGTMAQPVVYRVAQASREQGFASLRFNFRGVGLSRGRYSGNDEYRDIEAAAAFLRGRLATAEAGGGRRPPLALAGYSFGSVMAAIAAGTGTVPIQALALIAFVVRWEELPAAALDSLGRFRGPVLAVCGESDDLASPASVERALAGLGLDFRLAVIAGAGHLFEHRQREVGEQVAGFFADALLGKRPNKGDHAGPGVGGATRKM